MALLTFQQVANPGKQYTINGVTTLQLVNGQVQGNPVLNDSNTIYTITVGPQPVKVTLQQRSAENRVKTYPAGFVYRGTLGQFLSSQGNATAIIEPDSPYLNTSSNNDFGFSVGTGYNASPFPGPSYSPYIDAASPPVIGAQKFQQMSNGNWIWIILIILLILLLIWLFTSQKKHYHYEI